jgi:hypothetical protein
MTNSPNTISLKRNYNTRNSELPAGVAINPGYLLELYNNSSALNYKPHSVAGGKALKIFALEQDYIGKDKNTQYAIADTVQAGIFTSGDEVLAKLAASATAITQGDKLESAGDGTLRKCVDITAAAGTAITTRILADVTATPTQALVNNDMATIAAVLDFPGAIGQALETVDNSAGASEVFIRVILY